MKKKRNSKARQRYLERRKREMARHILNFAVEAGKMAFVLLMTLVMYNICSGIAYSERGYEAIGGEGLAAALFGAFVFYIISYADYLIRKAADEKEDTI